VPVEFLTDEQAAAFGQFTGPPGRSQLERCFLLDDDDLVLVARRRGDTMKLGFAIQLGTVRYLGKFLADPIDVPTVVVDYVAEQLGIADASCIKAYGERPKTAYEHAWEIQRALGYRDFAEAEQELAGWVDARAWNTDDGPKALFDAAVGWLVDQRVLLPGVSRLARLVAWSATRPTSGCGPPLPGCWLTMSGAGWSDCCGSTRPIGSRSWSGCAAARRGS
jgi:hypothetical protein